MESDSGLIVFLAGILSIIILIIFFVTAININKIKKILEESNKKTSGYAEAYNIGELREFQGKKQEALDSYMESYFFVNRFIKKVQSENINIKYPIDISKDIKNKDSIKVRILALGGVIPEIK